MQTTAARAAAEYFMVVKGCVVRRLEPGDKQRFEVNVFVVAELAAVEC